jgi:4-hydroxy-2-oxoheptanedioate aldolase
VIRSESAAAPILLRYLDAGAGGLVLPQVRQLADVETLLGVIAGHPADALAIPQIETREAVVQVEALAGIDGVDAWLIGPNDLAAEMGHPGAPEHPAVTAAVVRVAAVLRSARRCFGLPAPTPQARRRWRAEGAQLLYLPLPAALKQAAALFTEG